MSEPKPQPHLAFQSAPFVEVLADIFVESVIELELQKEPHPRKPETYQANMEALVKTLKPYNLVSTGAAEASFCV